MDKSIFAKTKYFIIDMDGTFYLSGNIIEGSKDFISKLRETGRDFYFFTNNSSNNVEVCREKLAKMGFPVDEDRVIVSSHVAGSYLNKNYPGKRVYLLGNERLRGDMIRYGINLVDDDPDIVLLGFDTTLTYEKIRKAANYLAAGVTYIATHPDVNCPMADGFMPDTGSMIEMFAASTGRRPLVLGKPMEATVDYITGLLGCDKSELAFVGDRLATDIAIGMNHGIPCALVYSGVTTREMYAKSEIRASVDVENLKALAEYL
ncbi:MAG: HAD-IIA family hydrolase [Clostridia bacterium]|nr:HAD-IIA family hydrolase [Clostridia bacterium]